MKIQFNGAQTEIAEALTLAQLLAGMNDLPENFAVAVNTDFVPRSAYADTQVADGDAVELLVPMQGG